MISVFELNGIMKIGDCRKHEVNIGDTIVKMSRADRDVLISDLRVLQEHFSYEGASHGVSATWDEARKRVYALIFDLENA